MFAGASARCFLGDDARATSTVRCRRARQPGPRARLDGSRLRLHRHRVSGRLRDRARLRRARMMIGWGRASRLCARDRIVGLAAASHALARTVLAFAAARFALGLGEAGNFPAAVRRGEWFPRRRGRSPRDCSVPAPSGAVLALIAVMPRCTGVALGVPPRPARSASSGSSRGSSTIARRSGIRRLAGELDYIRNDDRLVQEPQQQCSPSGPHSLRSHGGRASAGCICCAIARPGRSPLAVWTDRVVVPALLAAQFCIIATV